eukprot:CAMPEP_0197038986 /NCGR_PEP_ID=MMETSP1384-20130603/15856_1 /TAXON_ID=29189 /ORGANISM="Ammonia sp." /LENGTH=53 /DNA_ID=CAMNT_0042469513 /DNA_START=39 /DNA_END=197 /DNA_ORIENTATION=-
MNDHAVFLTEVQAVEFPETRPTLADSLTVDIHHHVVFAHVTHLARIWIVGVRE